LPFAPMDRLLLNEGREKAEEIVVRDRQSATQELDITDADDRKRR
jgi:hypothetical protein